MKIFIVMSIAYIVMKRKHMFLGRCIISEPNIVFKNLGQSITEGFLRHVMYSSIYQSFNGNNVNTAPIIYSESFKMNNDTQELIVYIIIITNI